MLESGASSAVDGNRHAVVRRDRLPAVLIPGRDIGSARTGVFDGSASKLDEPPYFGTSALFFQFRDLAGDPAEIFERLINRRIVVVTALRARRLLHWRRSDKAWIGIGKPIDNERRLAGSGRSWIRGERDKRDRQPKFTQTAHGVEGSAIPVKKK